MVCVVQALNEFLGQCRTWDLIPSVNTRAANEVVPTKITAPTKSDDIKLVFSSGAFVTSATSLQQSQCGTVGSYMSAFFIFHK